MKLYKFEIFYKEKSINNLDIPLLFQKSNKMIIIIDLIRNKIRENPSKSLTFGIFEIFFNEEKQEYNTKLMQEITIKEISDNYFINLISENKLAIFDNSIIYYITLDNNCLVDNICPYKMKESKKFNLYEDDESIRIYSNTNFEVSIIKLKKQNIKKYSSFIYSQTNLILKDIMNENREYMNKIINPIKNELKEQYLKKQEKEDKQEKISRFLIGLTQDNNYNANNSINNNMTNKNTPNKNASINNNQFNQNQLYPNLSQEQINYLNQINYITQINKINQLNQINQRNIDPRINQLNAIHQLNQIQQINNIQNPNSVLLYPNLINNILPINQQNFNNNRP
jgi:hypothetical protein